MKKILFIGLMAFLSFSSCENNVVIFSLEKDKELGEQVASEIESNPQQYPILERSQNLQAYNYLEDLFDEILQSGEVQYKDEFNWQISIIKDDSTLNAFATPGGYIYVYTGLIKYLNQEDDLMGVLGHEVAHSDLRHTSRTLQRSYGVSVLLSILTGGTESEIADIAAQVAGTVAGLSFSREFEEEADAKSVDYLANTDYACNGAYSFFQKLLDSGAAGNTPEFLSTHPDPEDRIADINEKSDEVGCSTTPLAPASYNDFKALLP